MPNHYSSGPYEFTLKVNSSTQFKNEFPFYKDEMYTEGSVYIELDLNPSNKIFEGDETIFDPVYLSEIFTFMSTFVVHLSKANGLNNKPERIGKILLNKNSPATANISFVSSHNGDIPPPRR